MTLRRLVLLTCVSVTLAAAVVVGSVSLLSSRNDTAPNPVSESGPTNTCPICGKTSVFGTFGNPPRAHIRCGACGSLERHRLLYLFLKQRTTLFTDQLSVLHFSPELGLSEAFRAQKNLKYATSWYEPDRAADYHLDLTQLTLPDNSWDVLIAYHILEHITDDRKAMREMYRVLKPGGWAVVQVPVLEQPESYEDPSVVTPREREEKFGQHDHVRYYGWKDFADRLAEAGFDVTIERFGRELSDDQIRTYALWRDERIYVIRKPAADRSVTRRITGS